MRALRGAALAGAAAAGVAVLTSGGPGRRLDRPLGRARNRDLGVAGDALFEGVTELGSIWASAGAAVALAGQGHRREAVDALGAAAAMWTLGQVAKRAILRPRPYVAL